MAPNLLGGGKRGPGGVVAGGPQRCEQHQGGVSTSRCSRGATSRGRGPLQGAAGTILRSVVAGTRTARKDRAGPGPASEDVLLPERPPESPGGHFHAAVCRSRLQECRATFASPEAVIGRRSRALEKRRRFRGLTWPGIDFSGNADCAAGAGQALPCTSRSRKICRLTESMSVLLSASFGVSSTIGRSRKRRSLTSRRNGSSPRQPWPRFA
jgi:hypothetical protein